MDPELCNKTPGELKDGMTWILWLRLSIENAIIVQNFLVY